MKGRVALYHGLEKGFEVTELPVPEMEPGGILVRVAACAICGSDLHFWRGDSEFPKDRLPRVPGHEFCGRVHSLGAGVTTDSLGRPLKEGDRVAYPHYVPCMRCYHCTRGELFACRYRFRRNTRYAFKDWPYCDGGFAEYYFLPPGHFVYKVPDELSDETVAPVNCALAQVLSALNGAGLRTGDTVVVQGAGGLGVYAAAVADDLGAGKVISIDSQARRLGLAQRCGASHIVDINEVTSSEDRVQVVRDLTEGVGADVVVEVAGVQEAVPEGIEMVRPGGTYLEIGLVNSAVMGPGVTQRTVQFIQHYNPWVIPAALDFLVRTRERYDLTKLVSHTFPLERVSEAFDAAEWMGGRETEITRAIVTP